ncbi:uncharacterized protein LOC143192401 [Rhynchophorus ferrugineus]|uniref:uncharacterized protein LOC143192401 n=1 Tax=Rhynchophorus ferrugineus TaxID=354439 RepID=UPI003FCE612D
MSILNKALLVLLAVLYVTSANTYKLRPKRSVQGSPIFSSVFHNPDPSKPFIQRFLEGSRSTGHEIQHQYRIPVIIVRHYNIPGQVFSPQAAGEAPGSETEKAYSKILHNRQYLPAYALPVLQQYGADSKMKPPMSKSLKKIDTHLKPHVDDQTQPKPEWMYVYPPLTNGRGQEIPDLETSASTNYLTKAVINPGYLMPFSYREWKSQNVKPVPEERTPPGDYKLPSFYVIPDILYGGSFRTVSMKHGLPDTDKPKPFRVSNPKQN